MCVCVCVSYSFAEVYFTYHHIAYLKCAVLGTLAVHCLSLHASTAGGTGLNPGRGTSDPSVAPPKKKIQNSFVFLVYLQNCTPSLPSNFRTFSISTHIDTQSPSLPTPQKNTLTHLPSPFLSKPLAPTDLFSDSMICLLWIFHIYGLFASGLFLIAQWFQGSFII